MLSADLWIACCDDAGLVAGRDAVLHQFPGRPGPLEPWASHIGLGFVAWEREREHFPFTPAQAAASMAARNVDEVMLRTGAGTNALVAITRHELQHATWRRDQPYVAGLSTAVGYAVREGYRRLPRAVLAVYGATAAERSADQAGRTLARRLLGAAPAVDRHGPHATLLAASDDAPAPGEEALAVIADAALFPAATARWVDRIFQAPLPADRALAALVECALPGAGDGLWPELVRAPALRMLRDELDAAAAATALFAGGEAASRIRALMIETERYVRAVAGSALGVG